MSDGQVIVAQNAYCFMFTNSLYALYTDVIKHLHTLRKQELAQCLLNNDPVAACKDSQLILNTVNNLVQLQFPLEAPRLRSALPNFDFNPWLEVQSDLMTGVAH